MLSIRARVDLGSNKRELRIPQSSRITGALLSDFLMSYRGHSPREWGSYPSAEMLSVYFTAACECQCSWICACVSACGLMLELVCTTGNWEIGIRYETRALRKKNASTLEIIFYVHLAFYDVGHWSQVAL